MSITYTSKFHSDDDPGGIIGEILSMGADFLGPAEDALVGWTLRLGDEIDPAIAARRLLVRYGYDAGAQPEGACGDLVRLLRETTNFARPRLGAHLCPGKPGHEGRRRGGRKSRRPS